MIEEVTISWAPSFSLPKAGIIGGLFAGAAATVEIFGLYDMYFLSLLTNVGMDGRRNTDQRVNKIGDIFHI